MKIVWLLMMISLAISLGYKEPKRYVINVECGGLTTKQCDTKAKESFQEYCKTSNDNICRGYDIFDYDEAAELDIDLSTVFECIDNYGSITKCKCKVEVLDPVTKQQGIKCQNDMHSNYILTPIAPTTAPITEEYTNKELTSSVTLQTALITKEITNNELSSSIKSSPAHVTEENTNKELSSSITSPTLSITRSKNNDKPTSSLAPSTGPVTEGITNEKQTLLASWTAARYTTAPNPFTTSKQDTSHFSDILSSSITSSTSSITKNNNKDNPTSSLASSTPVTEVITNEKQTLLASWTAAGYSTARNPFTTSKQDTSHFSDVTNADNLTEQGWIQASNKVYYRLFSDLVTYDEAKENCTQQRSNLASKVVREAFSEVAKTVTSTVRRAWIGLNDIETEGRWVWEDGVISTTNNTQWRDGEPNNNKGNENCAAIVNFKKIIKLVDFPCQNQLQYVCEKTM